ncbi:MAG: mannose-1-phosphate guanylyltransferase [Propionibacteriaceae bacterium]|nr:mannose-1-phosphate guanylyltransferase [Propionibacteriaceae bacterium]
MESELGPAGEASRYVVILAGGAGTRLWPLSRQGTPKQILPLFEGTSLLQLAFERARAVVAADHILICASATYLDVIAAQLPEVPAANLLGEPTGRDSLAAIAWSTAVVADRDPDAVVAVLSADQVITPLERFAAALDDAFIAAAADDRTLVTFGVVPSAPETGFGYLHRGEAVAGLAHTWEVLEFAEKPDLARAEAYLAAGDWWWNSGMFCWRAATLNDQVFQLVPAVSERIQAIIAAPEQLEMIYPGLPRVSVDYAIMEPTSQGAGGRRVRAVELPVDWHDVGGFPALAEQWGSTAGNAIEGLVVADQSSGNLLINRGADGHLVAVTGVQDLVVVVDGDVTLVCPLSAAQNVKQLVAQVRSVAGERYV